MTPVDATGRESEQEPLVSVVIPMLNEELHIERCLSSLTRQDYPAGRLEIFVVDGLSSDRSREIVSRFARGTPPVTLLDNPARVTPNALNTGILHSKGGVVVILGSHSYVEPDFVRRNVEALAQTGADCVGGRIETISDSATGRVISLAMSSPFGVGGARFRTSDKPGYVDTVAFGAYRREVFDRIGLFDEELVKNQDDEFNFRLTRSGGRIYLDPSIRSSYWSRTTLRSLWKQYYQYGRWKTRIFKKHGRLPSGRHIAPALALTVFAASVLAGLVHRDAAWLPLSLLAAYLAVSLAVTLKAVTRNGAACFMLPLAFATLHLSYALGFIRGLPVIAKAA
ncbi:MAG: glycosyltransferase family 2 protein [Gaiellales bacterium]|nr:MAG: glycosyltransferase family 2 protein [Gaiellales bacterium]